MKNLILIGAGDWGQEVHSWIHESIQYGVEYIFKAALELYKSHKNFEIHFFGNFLNDNKDSIDYIKIEEWSKEPFFIYKPFTDDIKFFLNNSHAVLLPSFYKEGTPKSLLEALAVGRPIITTDTPGCRDTVINNNGYLVLPRDIESLYIAMKNIIELPYIEIVKMGQNSRNLAECKFDDNIVLFEYMNCINHCLNNSQLYAGLQYG